MTTPTPSPSETWSQVSLFLEASLGDTKECVQWCLVRGLLVQPTECSKCRKDRVLTTRADQRVPLWRCTKCGRQKSVLVGSVFEGTKLSLGKALMLVLCYAQGTRISTARLAAVLGSGDSMPASTTVIEWFAFLRSKLETAYQGLSKLGGLDIIVQVDEALLGRRKYHRGRKMRGTWVLGMIAEDGEARFEVVADRSAATLTKVILKHVSPGSIILTDEWRAYSGLRRLGYGHRTVNHSVEFVSPDGTHTQQIESQWRALRRKFTRGGIRHDDIPAYLAEYVFRRRWRLRGESPFENLLKILEV